MREIKADSRNSSAHSVCGHSPNELADGALINLILTLPPDVTGNERVQVRCAARLSAQKTEGDQTVLLAEIEKYEFLSRHESQAAARRINSVRSVPVGGGRR